MIDWTQGNDWTDPGSWTIQSTYGGWFHVYAFTMTMGIILAVGFSAWKFWRKDISLNQLALGVVFIVPLALFGASFFGKLNAVSPGVNAGYCGFWGLFAFWHAGMAIHGGVYVGTIVGLIVFGLMGRKTRVSIWTYADCIIPNILLGQGIGRWGNFFNHEVVGAPVGAPGDLWWLPKYIQINTQFRYGGDTGTVINGIHLIPGQVYQMSPIFLIESISLIIAWGIITFIIPTIGKLIGPKPWKRHGNDFHFSWAQTLLNIVAPWKFLSNQNLEKVTIDAYSSVNGFDRKNIDYKNQSWFVVWKQAYYLNPNLDQREEFKNNEQIINSAYQNQTQRRYQLGKALNKANNPDKYWITKSGCEASAFFLFWNVVRFALELQRPEDHLFIMYEKGLSLALIGATGLIGLIGMVLTQTVIPTFFRQPGIQYEKQYFAAKKIDKQWFGKKPNEVKLISSSRQQKEEKKLIVKEYKEFSRDFKKLESKKPTTFSRTDKELKAQAKLQKLKDKQNNKK